MYTGSSDNERKEISNLKLEIITLTLMIITAIAYIVNAIIEPNTSKTILILIMVSNLVLVTHSFYNRVINNMSKVSIRDVRLVENKESGKKSR